MYIAKYFRRAHIPSLEILSLTLCPLSGWRKPVGIRTSLSPFLQILVLFLIT
jgi:hypothetical protein